MITSFLKMRRGFKVAGLTDIVWPAARASSMSEM
jgi:hypothetical protein